MCAPAAAIGGSATGRLLALKLILVPTLIGAVSLAGRRWGPAVSGWLVGLPLTSGPVSIFLTFEQGEAFAARAAQGTLMGLISLSAFCLVYCWLSRRVGWPSSTLGGWGAYSAITVVFDRIALQPVVSFVAVVGFIALALKLLPPSRHPGTRLNPPRWEIAVRMVAATALVVALTGFANLLGPQLSGLLAPFPVYATVLAIFTHAYQGSSAATELLRGVVMGSFSFAIFFLIVAGLVEQWGPVAAFGLATLAALLMHGYLLRFLKEAGPAGS